MISTDHVRLMAAYNRWQNENLYTAADGLDDAARHREMGAFFGSIFGTLNHLIWGDSIWLSRLANTSAPQSPGIPESVHECADWAEMQDRRARLDRRISAWAAALTPDNLSGDLTWHSAAIDRDLTRPVRLLMTCFVDQQPHHRGQVPVMLTASGTSPVDTDLILLPDES